MKNYYQLLRPGSQLLALSLKCFLAAGLFLTCLPAQEVLAKNYLYQGILVTGNVKDSDGIAMPGVNIQMGLLVDLR